MLEQVVRVIRIGLAAGLTLLVLGCSGSGAPTAAPTASGAASPAFPAGASTATTIPLSSPAAASPVAVASPSPVAVHDEDVTFTSGPDTLYGSFMLPRPAPSGKVPAALIISGSGPTDRNGNDAQFPVMDANLNFARTLAAAGIASFRYDKVTSGKTGLATHPGGQGVDFNLFLQEARDAYDLLASRPEVDPQRIIILGHSEGGLFALVLAQQLQGTAHPPHALVLAAPLSVRYLDLIKRQLDQQYQAAVSAGQVSSEQATAATQELEQIVTSVRQDGKFPATITTPALQTLFNPINQVFFLQTDKYDPAAIAAALPPTLPVLILHGEKDQQVDTADIDHLMQGFPQAGNQRVVRVELPNVDHIFKVVTGTPNPARDYADPSLPFSPEAAARLTAFVRQYVASQ